MAGIHAHFFNGDDFKQLIRCALLVVVPRLIAYD
jgi:hypothetical protein